MALPSTLQQALQSAIERGLERLDAQMLLLHALGRDPYDRAWLLAHDTESLPRAISAQFTALCGARRGGEPIAYLIGTREFYGLTLQVDRRVLDPRPDTETLVDWALELIPTNRSLRLLDLGTGSGVIALALAHERPRCEVWATDRSAAALEVAQGNAARLGLAVTFRQGDWLDAVARTRFDVIVGNPPYIAAGDPHLQALQHEPREALASGPDGLDDLRTLCRAAPRHLQPNGWLLLEHGWDQAPAVRALLAAEGLRAVRSRRDLAGIERCSGGRYAGAAASGR